MNNKCPYDLSKIKEMPTEEIEDILVWVVKEKYPDLEGFDYEYKNLSADNLEFISDLNVKF